MKNPDEELRKAEKETDQGKIKEWLLHCVTHNQVAITKVMEKF